MARRASLPLASTAPLSLDDLIARAVEHIGMIERWLSCRRAGALSRRRRGGPAIVLVDLLVKCQSGLAE